MQNGSHLSASVRILELDLSAALYELFEKKDSYLKEKGSSVKITATQPRPGGLCEGIFDAISHRADSINREELFAKNTLTLFAREKKIVFDSSVAGRDVFVVLDFALLDDKKVSSEYFLLANLLGTDAYVSLAQQAGQAAKKNGANKTHLLILNYPYARQDKDHGERGPISAEITAQNLEPYYDSVTSVHLHSSAIKGMFRAIPLHEISPNEIYTPSFVYRDPVSFESIAPNALTLSGVNELFSQLCIVSPDAGGAPNARNFAKYCKLFAATVLNVSQDQIVDIPMAQIDKRRSGPGASEVMNVLGRENVVGKIAIIVDDMGDTFGTATRAADALVGVGARSVEFWGTHGYFSGDAIDRINASPISRVSITNSMALRPAITDMKQSKVIDISSILAQVIIDLTTKPTTNMHIRERHLEPSDAIRHTLGRHIFAMMPRNAVQPQ